MIVSVNESGFTVTEYRYGYRYLEGAIVHVAGVRTERALVEALAALHLRFPEEGFYTSSLLDFPEEEISDPDLIVEARAIAATNLEDRILEFLESGGAQEEV